MVNIPKVETLQMFIPTKIQQWVSATSCQKGEYVYKTRFRYMIESININSNVHK